MVFRYQHFQILEKNQGVDRINDTKADELNKWSEGCRCGEGAKRRPVCSQSIEMFFKAFRDHFCYYLSILLSIVALKTFSLLINLNNHSLFHYLRKVSDSQIFRISGSSRSLETTAASMNSSAGRPSNLVTWLRLIALMVGWFLAVLIMGG